MLDICNVVTIRVCASALAARLALAFPFETHSCAFVSMYLSVKVHGHVSCSAETVPFEHNQLSTAYSSLSCPKKPSCVFLVISLGIFKMALILSSDSFSLHEKIMC